MGENSRYLFIYLISTKNNFFIRIFKGPLCLLTLSSANSPKPLKKTKVRTYLIKKLFIYLNQIGFANQRYFFILSNFRRFQRKFFYKNLKYNRKLKNEEYCIKIKNSIPFNGCRLKKVRRC